MKLKDSKTHWGKGKGKLSSIMPILREFEADEALELISWFVEKTNYFIAHKKRDRFKNLPNKMERGDIIWTQFGINVGDEFSDFKTDGHFAIYWAQNGFQIIVIPLSAEERKPGKNDFIVNLGEIEGLPKGKDTYAKVDMIRAVSLRRIKRINGQAEGKIAFKSLYPESYGELIEKIKEKLID